MTSRSPSFAEAGPRLRTGNLSPRLQVLLGLSVLFAARVLYLRLCPLELVPDEAYYWDWSRQLDWSYYSKPPMVAWLIALATAIGGHHEFSIRFPAALLGTLGLWGVYELGRRLYDHRIGVWATIAAATTPGLTALCLLMTVDAPFLCAWSCALYFLWRMIESDRPDARWLVPLVLATGLGLLSKQTMLALFPLAIAFLVTGSADRPKLRSKIVWIWIGGSLTFLVPVLWWNLRNDWITVDHTLDHFRIRSAVPIQHFTWFLEFSASQFGIISPFLCGLMLLVTIVLLARFRHLQRRERFLICFGALPMVAVSGLSFCQRVQPNWPAALHLTGFILVAAWGQGALSLSERFNRQRNWLRPAIATAAALSLALAFLPFAFSAPPLAGTTLDLTSRLRGWHDLANRTARIMQDFPDSGSPLIVAVTTRAPVSELAFYLPRQPRVYRWNVGGVVDSQHELWGGPQDGAGRDALIVTHEDNKVPKDLARAFDAVEDRGRIVVTLGPTASRTYRIWRGVRLREWPNHVPSADSMTSKLQQTSRD